jgi:hypothetical protein
MLPYFFRHYDSFVDRYVIFDDGSTDRSPQLLTENPKVDLRRFVRSDPDSFVRSEQALSNACWKEAAARPIGSLSPTLTSTSITRQCSTTLPRARTPGSPSYRHWVSR